MREVLYLYPQPGLTNPITLSTQGIKYRLTSIIYWLLNEWGPMRAQAGQQNAKPPSLRWQQSKMPTHADVNIMWHQHDNNNWHGLNRWNKMKTKWWTRMRTDMMNVKQNGTTWTNKTNPTQQLKRLRRIRSDFKITQPTLHFIHF